MCLSWTKATETALPPNNNFLPHKRQTVTIASIDEQAAEMMFRLVEKTADKEGVTEQLKAEAPMLWVGRRLWARRKKFPLFRLVRAKITQTMC